MKESAISANFKQLCVCWHSASKGNRLETYEMGQRRNSLEATQVCNSFLAQVRGSQAQ